MKKSLLSLFLVSLLLLVGCSKDNKETPTFPEAPTPEEPAPEEPADPTDDYANSFYPNEVKPSQDYKCFAGAYYHKEVSSNDVWTGIEGTVKLPTIEFDPARVNPNKPLQYMDNPSVYMGGNMDGQETDIGMTWEVIKDANGVVSSDKKAFRPFWRWTASGSQAKGYANAPAQAQYYWYQGEEITMSVRIDSKGMLKFVVDGAGKHFETVFECVGYNKGYKGQFKRVNAIDQVSNEGKPVQATKTKVLNAVWKSTYLYRLVNSEDVKVPMHTGRFTDMRCPDIKYFKIDATDAEKKLGAETITINGAGY